MKLLKWLFHPLYLLLAIIAVAIYANRDILFTSGDSAAQATASAETALVAAHAEERTPVAASAAMSQGVPAPQQGAKKGATPVSGPQVPLAAAVPPVTTETPRTDGAAAASKNLTQWHKARQFAWDNKLDDAVSAYQGLIELDPGNFDAYGELGNVYLQLGRWEAATESYHRAAILLQAAGNGTMAWHLQRIVQGLDRERGERLRNALLHRGEP